MRTLVGLIFLGLSTLTVSEAAFADTRAEKAKRLVVLSELTVDEFKSDDQMAWLRENFHKAKAVMIIPESVKGGFILGGSGGNGVFLARSTRSRDWRGPAFYTVGSITFGLQAGAEVSKIILMVMTDRGVDRLLTSSAKIGVDLSVAAGPVGAGAKAQTADVIAFAKSKGLYGGINLEGAVIKVRSRWNEAYYAQDDIRPRDILFGRVTGNAQARGLRQALRELTRQ